MDINVPLTALFLTASGLVVGVIFWFARLETKASMASEKADAAKTLAETKALELADAAGKKDAELGEWIESVEKELSLHKDNTETHHDGKAFSEFKASIAMQFGFINGQMSSMTADMKDRFDKLERHIAEAFKK
jgi:hypothetical protein